jgi:hypothetical protein
MRRPDKPKETAVSDLLTVAKEVFAAIGRSDYDHVASRTART